MGRDVSGVMRVAVFKLWNHFPDRVKQIQVRTGIEVRRGDGAGRMGNKNIDQGTVRFKHFLDFIGYVNNLAVLFSINVQFHKYIVPLSTQFFRVSGEGPGGKEFKFRQAFRYFFWPV